MFHPTHYSKPRSPLSVRPAPLIAALVAAVWLAGCSSVATDSGAAPPSEAPASTMPTAEPSPSPQTTAGPDSDDVATWTASGAGIGPLLVGSDFDTSATALGPYLRAADCPNPRVIRFEGAGLAPLWVSVAEDAPRITTVIMQGAASSRPPIESTPRTGAGIGLGDAVADLLAAYPDIQQTYERPGSVTYAVADGPSWLVFVVMDDVVGVIAASTLNTLPPEFCG